MEVHLGLSCKALRDIRFYLTPWEKNLCDAFLQQFLEKGFMDEIHSILAISAVGTIGST